MLQFQLLAQMLPLIVFIIVDSFCNNIKISIIASVVFAAGQLFFFISKQEHLTGLLFLMLV